MLVVAAAIIENGRGQLLIARRKHGKSQAGLWEFPGGKLESGESPEQCLKRELMEEMSITIAPYAFFEENEHNYGSGAIRLLAYKATYISGDIRLTDHDEFCWAKPSELRKFSFAPADIPFVDKLIENE